MNQDEYGLMVEGLVKPGAAILASLDATKVDLIHAAVGIAGEAGELLDQIKKHVVYNKELDVVNVIEELGDLEFYMEQLRRRLLLTRAMCLAANHTKLMKKRYPNGYSDQAAQERADKLPNYISTNSAKEAPIIQPMTMASKEELGELYPLTGIIYESLTPQELVTGWNKYARINDKFNADAYKNEIKRRNLAVHMADFVDYVKGEHFKGLVLTEKMP
jgi:hypothetical protein